MTYYLEIAIAFAGLLIAWFTYKKTFYSKPTEEKEHLLVQFKATQTLSNQVRENLEQLAQRNNWHDEDLFPNITYREYLKQMESSYNTSLSDSVFERLKSENYTKSLLLSMIKV